MLRIIEVMLVVNKLFETVGPFCLLQTGLSIIDFSLCRAYVASGGSALSIPGVYYLFSKTAVSCSFMMPEPLDPHSIVSLPFDADVPRMPDITTEAGKLFLKQLQASGHKWVVVTDETDNPRLVIDTDGSSRSALLEPETFDAIQYCHTPIIVTDIATRIGHILQRFEVQPAYQGDHVIDRDVVLI